MKNSQTNPQWVIQLNRTERKIFDNAEWKGFTVLVYERYTNGQYVMQKSQIPRVFLHDGQLYYPNFAPFTSIIISLGKLNMDKTNKNCGVYFEAKRV